ncbi:MAG: hypothetical protein J2P46_14340, partial [Zavarzinella sp.]|nr:hypothetical protein [Zavarzinella sp.]
MNELAQLFLHLLEPLRAQLDDQGIHRVEEEAASIRQVFDLARALRVGQDFGFYQGLLTGINGSPFNRRRLEEGAAEKQALARFCVQEFFQGAINGYPASSVRGAATGANRERWFFESGTTIAFVIGGLALAIHAAREKAGHSPA